MVAAIVLALITTCTVGDRVALRSAEADPNVFIWTDRTRLVAYRKNRWPTMRDVAGKAKLVFSNTEATIVTCSPQDNTAGVRLRDGYLHGAYGWITLDDVVEMTAHERRTSALTTATRH